MRTAQGRVAGAKIQHPLTSALGYEQTLGAPRREVRSPLESRLKRAASKIHDTNVRF